MVFPVVRYGCESWTIKKAEHWRMMLLNCGVGKDLRVPWTARRFNQSILKEISPEYSSVLKDWCWSSNILATWCEELIGKDPDAGKDWRQEEKGTTEDEMDGWHHWLNGHLSKFQEMVMDREAWCATVHMVTKGWTWLSDWTTTSKQEFQFFKTSVSLGHLQQKVFQVPLVSIPPG